MAKQVDYSFFSYVTTMTTIVDPYKTRLLRMTSQREKNHGKSLAAAPVWCHESPRVTEPSPALPPDYCTNIHLTAARRPAGSYTHTDGHSVRVRAVYGELTSGPVGLVGCGLQKVQATLRSR